MVAANRPPFSFDAPFVARSRFLFDGTWFEAGAAFDWQARGMSKAALFNLWRCAVVDCAPQPPVVASAPADPPPPAKLKPRARAGA